MRTRVNAQYLQPGDIIGSGETVVGVSAGLYTPRGKCDVVLKSRSGRVRCATWWKHTSICVSREKEQAS